MELGFWRWTEPKYPSKIWLRVFKQKWYPSFHVDIEKLLGNYLIFKRWCSSPVSQTLWSTGWSVELEVEDCLHSYPRRDGSKWHWQHPLTLHLENVYMYRSDICIYSFYLFIYVFIYLFIYFECVHVNEYVCTCIEHDHYIFVKGSLFQHMYIYIYVCTHFFDVYLQLVLYTFLHICIS